MAIALRALNDLDEAAFVELIGPVFENSPWIAQRTWPFRPFESVTDLHEALCETMYSATVDERVELIREHPDLVGRAAREGTLTPASTREQAGLRDLSPEEVALFGSYNAAYRERFGFPFVICARENKKESILAAFPTRLQNTRDKEIAAALQEIAKIAMFRLEDAVSDE